MVVETFDFDEQVIIGLENQNKKHKTKNSNNKNNMPNKNKRNQKKPAKKRKNAKIKNNKIKKNKSQNINKSVQKGKVVKKVKKLTPEQEEKVKKIYKIIKISTTIVILLIIVILVTVFTMFSPLFNIKEIIVSGNNKLSKETIISISEIVEGQNTYKVDKSKVESKIKENSAYINTVKIERKLPSTLEIKIEERVATFMIEYGGGYVYLDNQGYILEISNEKLELPILQGTETQDEKIKTGERLCKEDLMKFSTILKIIDTADQMGILNLITKIDISDEENYRVIFETEQKTAHLGDKSNIINKMRLIKIFIEDEKTIPGEIFVNVDLNKRDAYFRKQI